MEYKWIENWDCEMIYSESGFAELDCVFTTDYPEYGDKETWVVTKYEPNSLIEFVRFNSLRTIRYSITLIDKGDSTEAIWEQVVTSLSSEGNKHAQDYLDNVFTEMMKTIEKMINHYLETGTMLKIKG